jgi:DNA-binding NtrC family response regulator
VPTILIADDEKNIRATLARALTLEGHVVHEAADGALALERIEAGDIDLVLLDLQMPVVDGLELLKRLSERGRRPPAIVLTAHGSIEKAVKAVRLGAVDFIEKPPAAERVLLAVGNALRLEGLAEENRRLREEAGTEGRLVGSSRPMRELAETLRRVAPTGAGVLIVGENGSGKELVARALHGTGPRSGRPLVIVNCAAVPATLFESELFGHARGAFTGATEARRGKFQLADGGTLFLDEIGEVPLDLQAKMLRAIESGEVERVGGRGAERVDVRVIAATNRDLEAEVSAGRFRRDLYYRLLVVPIKLLRVLQEGEIERLGSGGRSLPIDIRLVAATNKDLLRAVREGRFREDLYYRLNVISVPIPPLRDRRDDIPELAALFLAAACRRHHIRPKRLGDGALEALEAHSWPGNVRELRNAMERVSILAPGEEIASGDLAFLAPLGGSGEGVPAPRGPFDLAAEMERHERALVLAVLERSGWRMTRAARELGLERSHLYKKLRALGIDRPTED